MARQGNSVSSRPISVAVPLRPHPQTAVGLHAEKAGTVFASGLTCLSICWRRQPDIVVFLPFQEGLPRRVAHIWLTVACRRYYNNWGCPTFRAFRKVGLPTARRLLIYFEGTDVLGAGVPRSNPSVLRSSSMSGQ
jgi:hypothetical protein